LVLHQKRLIPGWQFRALRRHARRLIYDFDDPMIYSRKDGRAKLSSTRLRRFQEVLRAAARSSPSSRSSAAPRS
jgi:hypothetical protein